MTTVLQFPTQQAPAPRREYATAVESAKALRQALKARFPKTKFSVRLNRGTAYGMCDVSWVDGPTEKLADSVIQPFSGEGFDGMTDSSYHITALLPDGKQSGLRLIHSSRSYTAAFLRRVVAAAGAAYHVPEAEWPEVTDSKGWGAEVKARPEHKSPLANAEDSLHWSWESVVRRAAEDRTSLEA